MKNVTLSKKILLLLVLSIAVTILFSFFFIHYLYSNLYLKSIEESIIYEGNRTASHYHYGELNEDIIEKIQWYNIISQYEVIVVDDLEQLSSKFPYEVNYSKLVDVDERTTLESGEYVLKEGFVEELDREIIGAIFPIKGADTLIGFIYIYVPLAAIQDVFQDSIPLLILFGSLFFFVLFLIVNRFWASMFGPLQNLQKHAVNVSHGDYSSRLVSTSNDEIGQLINAFNSMSLSLEEQDERKKEFTSNIVHELRTPLTYIQGYTQALKDRVYSSPEEAEHYLETIEKETARLSKLVNDIVELNHLQEDLYLLEKEPIAIAQLLHETLELFVIHLKKKNLTLHTIIDEDVILLGDPNRIQQIFYNTIDNAIKYSNNDSLITVNLSEQNQQVHFSVHNFGTTISSEDIKRIGERFFRTDKARTRTTGGTGLGLSIVKEIVRLHNGEFSITSNEIDGTTIHITLATNFN